MPEPQIYGDYFDPHIHYIRASPWPKYSPLRFLLCTQGIEKQVMEEIQLGKRIDGSRWTDIALPFKRQKAIPKEEKSKSKSEKRSQWWKNPFGLLWKSGRSAEKSDGPVPIGPLYQTESMECRTVWGFAGPMSAAEVMEDDVPYVNLSDLNALEAKGISAAEALTPPPMQPIYLVT